MNTGDTAFMMICAALVFFMTPGLAFFYGGLVRRKNVCNTIMACVAIMGLSVVMWTLFGYSLSFGGNHAGIIGDFRWFGLNGVGMEAGPYADSIPHLVFCAFQMMFAMITPALITGSLVGRMKFKALFLFVAIWSVIVYYPMTHMVWGDGGFLAAIGSVDFAGGDVVHISSGISALVLAIILGRRRGYEHTLEFLTSAFSAAADFLSCFFIDTIKNGKTTLVGAATGLVVGLVAITPGAGFVPIWSSFIIGALVSPICYFGVGFIKKKLKIDDALDAFGCHGIGGIWGGIATGIFTQKSINPVARWDGLIFGDYHLFVAQIVGIIITIAVAVVGTLICVAIVRVFTPLRVSVREEQVGLDISEHGESAYPSFNGLDQ